MIPNMLDIVEKSRYCFKEIFVTVDPHCETRNETGKFKYEGGHFMKCRKDATKFKSSSSGKELIAKLEAAGAEALAIQARRCPPFARGGFRLEVLDYDSVEMSEALMTVFGGKSCEQIHSRNRGTYAYMLHYAMKNVHNHGYLLHFDNDISPCIKGPTWRQCRCKPEWGKVGNYYGLHHDQVHDVYHPGRDNMVMSLLDNSNPKKFVSQLRDGYARLAVVGARMANCGIEEIDETEGLKKLEDYLRKVKSGMVENEDERAAIMQEMTPMFGTDALMVNVDAIKKMMPCGMKCCADFEDGMTELLKEHKKTILFEDLAHAPACMCPSEPGQ